MSPTNGTSDDDDVAQFDICSSTSTMFPILKICNNYLLEKSATVDDLSTALDRIRRCKKSSLSTNYYSYYKRNMELNDTTTYEYCEIITKNCVGKSSERHRLTELKFLSKSIVQRSIILERMILYLILIMKCLFYDGIFLRIAGFVNSSKTAQFIAGCFILHYLPITDACSTRPSPKPRPPRPIWSPEDVTLERQNCSEDYVNLFCLNGGTCFTSKFYNSWELGCQCAPSWYGRRCEYLDVGLLPVQQRIETASIAGGVTVLIILLVFTSFIVYVYRRRNKIRASGRHISPSIFDEPDHRTTTNLPVRPFSIRRTRMDQCVVHVKNEIVVSPTSSTTTPSDERSSQPLSQNFSIVIP